MDRPGTRLAIQCASVALLSVSLWYFYKTRRRHLLDAAARRELDLLHWQKELQGLEDADEEDSVLGCYAQKDSVVDADGAEIDVSLETSRHRCSKALEDNCGPCAPGHNRIRSAVRQQTQDLENVTEVQKSELRRESSVTEAKIFYASQTGNSKRLADKLLQRFVDENFTVQLVDPATYEPEDLPSERLVIFVVSTWENGAAPDNASFFGRWLEESSLDFRVGSWLLRGCKYAIFGLGSKAYGSSFNLVARSWDRQMAKLGATRIVHTGEGDQDEGPVDAGFEAWADDLVRKLKPFSDSPLTATREDLSPQKEDHAPSEESSDYHTDYDEEDNKENRGDALIDLEDVVGRVELSDKLYPDTIRRRQVFRKKSSNKESRERGSENQLLSVHGGDTKEMVTSTIRSSLEKQVHSSVRADCHRG